MKTPRSPAATGPLPVARLDPHLIVWGNVKLCGRCVVAWGMGRDGKHWADALELACGRPVAWHHPDHGWVDTTDGRVLHPCNDYREASA